MSKRRKKKIQSIIIKPKQRPKIKTEEEMRQFLHTRLKGSNKKKNIERRGKYKNDYSKEF